MEWPSASHATSATPSGLPRTRVLVEYYVYGVPLRTGATPAARGVNRGVKSAGSGRVRNRTVASSCSDLEPRARVELATYCLQTGRDPVQLGPRRPVACSRARPVGPFRPPASTGLHGRGRQRGRQDQRRGHSSDPTASPAKRRRSPSSNGACPTVALVTKKPPLSSSTFPIA